MRRLATGLAALILFALPATGTAAQKGKSHMPSGVEGVVVLSPPPCTAPCVQPLAEAVYAGAVTVSVTRPSDGTTVASQAITDGQFRLKVKKGVYEVSSVPPGPSPCPPNAICAGPIIGPGKDSGCLLGETTRAKVRRHRFTEVELHVTNVCVASAADHSPLGR
jgi:hypothetical protein